MKNGILVEMQGVEPSHQFTGYQLIMQLLNFGYPNLLPTIFMQNRRHKFSQIEYITQAMLRIEQLAPKESSPRKPTSRIFAEF